MSKKPSKKTMTRKLDDLVSKIVRSRGACANCECGDYDKLQAAHIYSRTLRSVRFDFDNLVCLCWSCHASFHQRPADFGVWIKENYLGPEKYKALQEKAKKIRKWKVSEMIELHEELTQLWKESYPQ